MLAPRAESGVSSSLGHYMSSVDNIRSISRNFPEINVKNGMLHRQTQQISITASYFVKIASQKVMHNKFRTCIKSCAIGIGIWTDNEA